MRSFWSSFRFKVTFSFILALFVVVGLGSFLFYKLIFYSQLNDLKDKLILVAQTSVLMVDADVLGGVPLNKEGINSPQYKIIAEKLSFLRYSVIDGHKVIGIQTSPTTLFGFWQTKGLGEYEFQFQTLAQFKSLGH